jgi:hypothetical protein
MKNFKYLLIFLSIFTGLQAQEITEEIKANTSQATLENLETKEITFEEFVSKTVANDIDKVFIAFEITKSENPNKIENSNVAWEAIYKNIIEFTTMLPNADLNTIDEETKESLLMLINVIYENLDYLHGNIGIQLQTNPQKNLTPEINDENLENLK